MFRDVAALVVCNQASEANVDHKVSLQFSGKDLRNSLDPVVIISRFAVFQSFCVISHLSTVFFCIMKVEFTFYALFKK